MTEESENFPTLDEAEIRRDERQRLADLLDASKELLVDFTGASTIAVVEMIVFLLRLDQP